MTQHRFFFADRPPEEVRRRIGIRRRAYRLQAEVADDRVHGTLAITGDYARFPTALVDALIAIGARVRAAPGEIVLDRVVGSHRSIALRPPQALPRMRELQAPIEAAMRARGLLRAGWRFGLHYTLGYRDGAPFICHCAPIRWRNASFVLIHSLVGETRHEVIGRWPLIAAQRSFDFG